MTPSIQDLERRRPVWEALSTLFLDTELGDDDRQRAAQAIIASAYSPSDLHEILWEEVYPVVECNLRPVPGEWKGFDLGWFEGQILSGRHRRTLSTRIAGALPFGPASVIRQEWQALLRFLPDEFRQDAGRD